ARAGERRGLAPVAGRLLRAGPVSGSAPRGRGDAPARVATVATRPTTAAGDRAGGARSDRTRPQQRLASQASVAARPHAQRGPRPAPARLSRRSPRLPPGARA